MSVNLHNNYIKIVEALALSIVSVLTVAGCSFSVSSAKLENLKVCSKVSADKQCATDTTTFAKGIPKLYATADLNYAPEGTQVKIDWKYLGGEAGTASDIDTVKLATKDNMMTITSHLTASDRGFPAGKYEVVMSLNTDNFKPIHKQFSIASVK